MIAMSEHLHLSANKWLVQHQFFPSNYYSKWMFGDFENGAELIAADKSILLSFFQLQKSNDRRSKRPWRRTTTLKKSTIALRTQPTLAPSSKQDMVSHLPFFGIPGATTIYNFDARGQAEEEHQSSFSGGHRLQLAEKNGSPFFPRIPVFLILTLIKWF